MACLILWCCQESYLDLGQEPCFRNRGFLGQIIAHMEQYSGCYIYLSALAAMVAGLLMKKKWPHVIGILQYWAAWLPFLLVGPLGFSGSKLHTFNSSAYPAATWGVNLIRSKTLKKCLWV